MHRRGHLRDELLPPSSRSGRRVGYRFATVASLVRFERMPVREAERVVDEWGRYVRARMRQGKSPASTAEHIARFERQRLSSPFRRARDPGPRILNRPGAGERRISERGFPYRVCPRGVQIHSLLFPLDRYTEARARRWAVEHGFNLREVELTRNFVRIKQNPVSLFVRDSFRNVPLRGVERHGIRAVMGCPRLAVIRGGQRRRQKPREERRRVAADW